jgi:UDP-N-acetylglucosamine 2-epimerase
MRTVSIVGARPQFVKLAPVCRALARHNANGGPPIEDLIVHTGQHYDPGMSDVFFAELDIPRAGVDLGVGSGPHGAQTARMLEGIERLLLERRPDAVVVYGDTNSTVAGALAAAKLHIRSVHVEAGLRSFNRAMPEEINRIATDHISDLLLAPTPTAMRNLAAEQLGERSLFTGDVMYDAVLHARQRARERSQILERLKLPAQAYGVVTLHRAENTTPQQLRGILEVLNAVAEQHLPLVFPVHPRTAKVRREEFPAWQPHARLRLIEPLGYLDMVNLVDSARMTLTDSGGLQKEAFFLGCPCVTLRTETEWVETVAAGGNVVAGTEREAVMAAVARWLTQPARPNFGTAAGQPFGDGHAADAIVAALSSTGGAGH